MPKTAALTNTKGTNKMSVFIKEEFETAGHLAEALPGLLNKDDYGVLAFPAQKVRELGQGIVRQQLDSGPPGHANVIGEKNRRTKSRFQGPLLRTATW